MRIVNPKGESKRSSHFFTLIEVMIAFALVSVLLSTLMGFYWQLNILQLESDQLRREAFHLRYLQSRLADVLPRAVQPKEAKSFFYISDQEEGDLFSAPSLVFSYDNGTDIDPKFSNEVLARLYHMRHEGRGELWLATWPRPACSLKPELARRELLMENVEKIAFAAYQPPGGQEPEATENATIERPPPDSWETHWKATYWRLPAILKLSVTPPPVKGATAAPVAIDFYFPLPNSENPIMMIP